MNRFYIYTFVCGMLFSCISAQAATDATAADSLTYLMESLTAKSLGSLALEKGKLVVFEAETCVIGWGSVLFIPAGATVELKNCRLDCFGTIVFEEADSCLRLDGGTLCTHRKFLDLRHGRLELINEAKLTARSGCGIYTEKGAPPFKDSGPLRSVDYAPGARDLTRERLAELCIEKRQTVVLEKKPCVIRWDEDLFIPAGSTVHLKHCRLDCFGTIIFEADDSCLLLEETVVSTRRKHLDLRSGTLELHGGGAQFELRGGRGSKIHFNAPPTVKAVSSEGASLREKAE